MSPLCVSTCCSSVPAISLFPNRVSSRPRREVLLSFSPTPQQTVRTIPPNAVPLFKIYLSGVIRDFTYLTPYLLKRSSNEKCTMKRLKDPFLFYEQDLFTFVREHERNRQEILKSRRGKYAEIVLIPSHFNEESSSFSYINTREKRFDLLANWLYILLLFKLVVHFLISFLKCPK